MGDKGISTFEQKKLFLAENCMGGPDKKSYMIRDIITREGNI